MTAHLKKAAFLVISAINPKTDEREYLFMKASPNSTNSGKIALFGGEVEHGEAISEGLGRELTEETGYEARELHHFGTCYPNPAVQDNELHFYLALGCAPTAQQSLDPNEEIEVLEMPYEDFLAYDTFDEQHGLHAAGLFYLERFFAKRPELRPNAS